MHHLVDTHFHADLTNEPAATLRRCESAGIYTITVTNAPSVYDHSKRLTDGMRYVRAAVGLHPELVKSHSHELPDLLRLLAETRYIGEVGLDYVTASAELRLQQRGVFEAVLDRAAELGGKIITVHSRRAAADVVACIGNCYPGTVILHWFSGSSRQLNNAISNGCHFSVNPDMLCAESGRRLVMAMPRERVLTETDGPFVKVGDRGAEPSDVNLVIEGLAELWRVDFDEAATTVFQNFASIVRQVETTSLDSKSTTE